MKSRNHLLTVREFTNRHRENISASAKARGQTGFLKPFKRYTVTVGERLLFDGTLKKTAVRLARTYQGFAAANQGWAAGKSITVTCDGKHIPF